MCFGGDSKSQASNTNSSSNTATDTSTTGSSASAPTNPNIDPAVSGLVQAATTQAQKPLSLYNGQMVAPLTDTQNTAIGQINAASGLAQPYYDQAANYAKAGATPYSAGAVDQYLSPYLSQVLGATQASQNQQDAQQQQSLAGNITAAGAWGGDRSGVVQSELAGQQKLADNATNANIENQGWNTALGQFNASNAANANAATSLAGIGNAAQSSALAGANSLFNAGTAQQQVNQENLNVPYEQYLQQQQYPYQNLDFLSSILSGAAGTSGTTTNQSGNISGTNNMTGTNVGTSTGNQSQDPGSTILGAGLSLASLFLKDGGRTRLADGGSDGRYTLPNVPQITTYIPAPSTSGRTGLAPPGTQSLGAAAASAPSPAAMPSLWGSGDSSGSSDNGMKQGEGLGTSLGNIGQSLFSGGAGEANGGGDFIGSASDTGALGGIGSFLSSLASGGRAKLADGGFDEPVYGDDDDTAALDGDLAMAAAPTGASAMSLADTPPAWRGQVTNYAPEAAQGTSLASNTDTDYTPPADLGGTGLAPDASAPPAWDDGTPITTGASAAPDGSGSGWGGSLAHPAHIVQPAYTQKPDWRRALLTAGTSMMAAHTGYGLANVGEGFKAGAQDYYNQLDKDNHPEVDHSGPTTTVRYADGTVVDTGIPTEAAINAQSTNQYRITNAQQMSADRRARIQAQLDMNANSVAERAAAAKDAAANRTTQLKIAGMNADQGHYTYQPATQDDPVTGKPVAGYLRLSTRGDEAPQFISGYTPLKGANGAGGMQGGREGVMFNRVVSAGNSAAAAAKNIMELPSDTNSGWFAGRHQGPGLLGATKESLTNTLTSQDVQDYNSMVPGVTRNLGALETQGLAVPGSMTHSMDGVLLKQGDTELTKLRKMAEMRQIIETNLEPQLSNPRVPPEQKQLVTKIIGQIQQTIPFTHHDITQLEKSGKGTSLAAVATQRGLGPQSGGGQVSTKAQFDALPSGTVYTGKDGKQYRKP